MSASPSERRPGVEAAILAVAVAGTVAGVTLGVVTGRPNGVVYLAVLVVGGVVVGALHLRVGFSRATLAGLVVFGLSHLAGGMVPSGEGVLYARWLWEPVVRYDNLQHAVGFGVVGRASWELLRGRLGTAAADPVVAWWTIVLAAAALGAANEVVEWGMTLTIPGTDVGGYDNTARDLVADLVGGVVAATWTARQLRGWRASRARSGGESEPAALPSHGEKAKANH